MSEVVGLVGVYHARGGVRGEFAYAVGRLLGTSHCALCDITHATVGRKPAWDAMTARLGVPFELAHLDEVPGDVAAAIGSGRYSDRRRTSTGRGRAHPADTARPGDGRRSQRL